MNERNPHLPDLTGIFKPVGHDGPCHHPAGLGPWDPGEALTDDQLDQVQAAMELRWSVIVTHGSVFKMPRTLGTIGDLWEFVTNDHRHGIYVPSSGQVSWAPRGGLACTRDCADRFGRMVGIGAPL